MQASPTATLELDDQQDYSDPDLTGYQGRLAALRDANGLARIRLGPLTGLAVLRHADVLAAFSDWRRFSKSEILRPATFPFIGPNMQGFDGEAHRINRGLVSRAFSLRAIRDLVVPLIRPTAEALVDELAPLGETDLMATFAKKFPLRIMTRMLGIPREDEDRMAGWAYAMLRTMREPEQARRAYAAFRRYVEPLVERRRASPADDLLSTIVTEELEGQRLSDEEVYGFLLLLFPAGVDTVWLTLGSMMTAVLERPDLHPRLIANREDRLKAVEETLRWEPATGTEPRMTMADVVVAGIEIPAGQQVFLATPVANRDPRVFENPDVWDIDRPGREHVGFGLGTHICLGAALARAELDVALEVLLTRLPNLRMIERPPIYGATLRGPRELRLAWDAP